MSAATRLEKSRAFVTGAGSGLGKAIALDLARRGARIVVAELDAARAEETVGEIAEIARTTGNGAAGFAFACDVTKADDVEAGARFAEEKLGGVDVVVNNAGVAVGGRTGEVSLEDWRHVVAVNLWGVIHGCHVFVPRLRRQKSGLILNVASAAGLLSPPELGPYNVTKAGVVALSETLHTELADDNIGVTCLCPTFFKTRILEASRGPQTESDRKAVAQMMKDSKLQAPEVAAAALAALESHQLYAVPMWDGWLLWSLKRLAPGAFYRYVLPAGRRFVDSRKPA